MRAFLRDFRGAELRAQRMENILVDWTVVILVEGRGSDTKEFSSVAL